MDSDPDSLADRSGPVGSPPPELEELVRRARDRQTRRQLEQDAWVARWPGWAALADSPAPSHAPPDDLGPQSDHVWRPKPRTLVSMALGAVVGIGLLGGILIKVPYIAVVPGTARDTEPLIEVAGIEEYPSDGELLFTTVRVRQELNIWEYLWLEWDDDANVVREEEILGDRTRDENRQFNLSLMTNSKQIAVGVALQQLGYDAIGTDGVVILALVDGGPADGLLEPGDTVVAIDGEPTLEVSRLVDILRSRAPGDTVSMTVEPFGSDQSEVVDVVLAENPEVPGAGFLGVNPASRPSYGEDVDFAVEIDSGSVGGPSAGLAFTLAILDQLTAGELTGGERVAVTGQIFPDGTVGPVGGVRQKTAAVEAMGIDVFIVPAQTGAEELAAAIERAGDDLTIIPVETLDEALAALSELGGDVDAVADFAAGNQPEPGDDEESSAQD